MSGGSYEYLFCKDPGDLFAHRRVLEEMADRLAGLEYAEDAARETQEMLLILRQADVRLGARLKRLSGVFRAVEWWDSGDSGEDDLKEALLEYRTGFVIEFEASASGRHADARYRVRRDGEILLTGATREQAHAFVTENGASA